MFSFFFKRLKIKWHKCDELDSLIRGVKFLNSINPHNECYYFDITTNEDGENVFTKKNFNVVDESNFYPYIIVNIGSGVSILLVNSETSYKRIAGTR